MTDARTSDALIRRLSDDLGQGTATELVACLEQAGSRPAALMALLDELEDLSPKAACAAIEALPDLNRRAGLSQVVAWLDLGVALAESSGATALKYFKDSPLILGVVERSEAQAALLTGGLELAEQDANVTLEYVRTSPQILAAIPPEQLSS